MRTSTDARIRRGLLVPAAALLCLSLAQPAAAKQEKINFLPGTDISSWYWQRQIDQEVTTPVNPPPPVPPVSQRVRLPNPQRPDTLPVALNNGQPERMSAVKFELLERGVTEGSEIKKLELFIEESQDRNENPSFRPDAAKIQACYLNEFLPQGESEQWDDAPKYSDSDCVPGTRDAPAGAIPVWHFDLSKIAEPWGKNPFDNNGVMLVPVAEAGQTWQVNLKVPRKADADTTNGDEYELSKNRAFITIDFIPGEPVELEIPETPAPPADAAAGATGTTTGGSVPVGGSPVLPGPSTDLTGGSGTIPGAETPAPPAPPTETAGFALPQEQGPRMPAYVWLAIPLGLLALSAVRSVVLEPVGGPRPDGVIAAIRRRNAQRRGAALGGGTGLLGRVRGSMRGVGSGLSSLTRKVRRKP